MYSVGNNLPLILSNVKHDRKNILYWFRITLFKANPEKIQFMILGTKNRFKYNLKVGSINNKEVDEVELREVTIDKDLNFRKNIDKLYRTAQ